MNKVLDQKVFSTDEYDKFMFFPCNRAVNLKHVEDLKDKMNIYGYIGSPITVNEYMYVVDGQHRLCACKDNGIPVKYVIEKGLTEEHIAVLNNTQKSWPTKEYVYHYAKRGNENYYRLKQLMDSFDQFGIETICAACHITNMKDIPNGDVCITKNDYIQASKTMTILEPFIVFKKHFPRPDRMYKIMIRLFESNIANPKQMYEKLDKYGKKYDGGNDFETMIKYLENIYNVRQKKNVYFYDKYREIYPTK